MAENLPVRQFKDFIQFGSPPRIFLSAEAACALLLIPQKGTPCASRSGQSEPAPTGRTFNFMLMIVDAQSLSRFPSSSDAKNFIFLPLPSCIPRPQPPIFSGIIGKTGLKPSGNKISPPIFRNLDQTVKFYAKSPFGQVDNPRGVLWPCRCLARISSTTLSFQG